jgi:hypothetical protein
MEENPISAINSRTSSATDSPDRHPDSEVFAAVLQVFLVLVQFDCTSRHQLFVYCDLFAWLDNPFEGPPALAQVNIKQLPF